MADEDDPSQFDDADARGLADDTQRDLGRLLSAASIVPPPASPPIRPMPMHSRRTCPGSRSVRAMWEGASAASRRTRSTPRRSMPAAPSAVCGRLRIAGIRGARSAFSCRLLPRREISPPIGAIGICHRTSTTVYVGTGEPVPYKPPGIGLYRTIDGGYDIPGARRGGQRRHDRRRAVMTASWSTHGITTAPGRPARVGLWRSSAAPPTVTFAQDMIATAAGVVAAAQDVTDVAIDFGDRSAAAAPATFTVYAAIRNDGIYRAVFDRASNDYLDLNAAAHPFQVAGAAAGVKWTKLAGDFPSSDRQRRQREPARTTAASSWRSASASPETSTPYSAWRIRRHRTSLSQPTRATPGTRRRADPAMTASRRTTTSSWRFTLIVPKFSSSASSTCS